jgi:O-succinylbenzoic acid--CoA ligase
MSPASPSVPVSGVLPCPVRESARGGGTREALRFEARRWTWAEVDGEVARWAAALAGRGLGRGGRVALLSGSRPEVLFLVWAAARLGAAVVPLNARLTPAELAPLVARAGAGLHLAEASLAAHLPSRPLRLEDLAEEAARGPGDPSDGAPVPLDAAAPWLVLFTSGTTGRPKAAVLGVGQMAAAARASAARLNGPQPPRWLGTLPLFHIGGLAMAGRCAFDGGSLVLHRRFEAEAAARALAEDGITHASLVPTTLERVLEARGDRPFPEGLRAVLIGGGPVPPALLARARAHRLPCLQTYGLTETCSQVTTERPEGADGRSAGEPLPGVEVRVVDAGGQPLPPEAEGEVEVRGPTVMAGYLDDPEATAAAFRAGGWLRTGDLGARDAGGRLRILSRRVDLIVRGGENVYPAEVEAVLLQHPAVAEAAVLPERHPSWGQVPVAVVVLRPGAAGEGEGSGTAESVLAFAAERLARFKLPVRCVLRDVLPRNAMNKVDRNALRRLTGIEPQ